VSILSGLYPAVWGIAQLGTGEFSDRVGRRALISGGMLLQGVAIFMLGLTTGFFLWASAAVLLGLGTAMVYPTLAAAVADVAHPSWRASAMGVYRLWRDSGYAIGVILAGTLADRLGYQWAISFVGALTITSGLVAGIVMYETHDKASSLAQVQKV
jgi:MFS family permease